MSEARNIADPAIVATWVAAWAISRGVAPPLPIQGGWYVEVGKPEQHSRYVFPALDETRIRELAEQIVKPWKFLKICAPSESVIPLLPSRWVVQRPGYLMTTVLQATNSYPPLADCLVLKVCERDEMVRAEVANSTGAIVASGNLIPMGVRAIFDQIVTDEGYRRMGLGRAIMVTLANHALGRGAHQGVLVATPAGRELYTALGWSTHSAYTSAVIPGGTG